MTVFVDEPLSASPNPTSLPRRMEFTHTLHSDLELAQDKVIPGARDPAAGQPLIPEHLQPNRRDPRERRRHSHRVGIPDRGPSRTLTPRATPADMRRWAASSTGISTRRTTSWR